MDDLENPGQVSGGCNCAEFSEGAICEIRPDAGPIIAALRVAQGRSSAHGLGRQSHWACSCVHYCAFAECAGAVLCRSAPRRTQRKFNISRTEVCPISSPIRIPRSEHSISRSRLSRGALHVLYGLKDAGYDALLVGGSVRDLLLGLAPKDFDVATNASPEEVKEVFRRCRLIGRRFRLAHVRCGPEIIEVATFRAAPRTPDGDDDDPELDAEPAELSPEAEGDDEGHVLHDSGRILRDNVYGTMEQDAFRRDFTINALYYDIRDFSVVDYVGGAADLADRRLRLIGDPDTRYREDPVRMLRAVRFAAKLDCEIDASARDPLPKLKQLLADVPPARLFDEVLKLFLSVDAVRTFDGLRSSDLFDVLFPLTARSLAFDPSGQAEAIIRLALKSTADRIAADKPVTPGFLFAAMLWPCVRERMAQLSDRALPPAQLLALAADQVIGEQGCTVAIPRRFSAVQNEIWQMQARFDFRRGKRPARLVAHKRFRAAYDFLCLRAQAGEIDPAIADWWTEFQELDEEGRQQMADAAPSDPAAASRRKRRRRRRPAATG